MKAFLEPPTRGQQAVFVGATLAIAFLLHYSTCDWIFGGPVTYGRTVCAYLGDPVADPRLASSGYLKGYGVFSEVQTSRQTSLLLGLVAPIALLGAATYIWLGWRRRTLLAEGHCVRCGYKLTGTATGPCPECGTTS